MKASQWVTLILGVPVVASAVGLFFGIAPCYLIAPFTNTREWCGYKSGPPHLEAQFALGAALGAAAVIWAVLRRR